ncbi:putative ankyrin repeat protein [Trichoderma austrokoningii]
MTDAYLKIPPTPEDDDGVNERAESPETQTQDLFSQSGDSLSEERQLGLDIVYPRGWSGSPHSDYDVVTVHGIRDDYETAWTEEDGTWWLKDKLFRGSSIREVDYSYEIDEDAAIFEKDGINTHAEELLTAYAKDRAGLEETEVNRPIIWICHDLGGTIVKEALYKAMTNNKKYGKIAILTTTIIFLGTPHQSLPSDDLEEQIYLLLSLPGPPIGYGLLHKVRNMACSIQKINDNFLATKLLDRALIFNVFVQNWDDSLRQRRALGYDSIPEGYEYDDVPHPITSFPRYTHHIGHSFEAFGRVRLNVADHANLIRGDYWNELWIEQISDILNAERCITKINDQLLQLQAHFFSLAPPTRNLNIKFDPLVPNLPIFSWISQQEPYLAFSRASKRPQLMHLYVEENSSLDIRHASRFIYFDFNSDHSHSNAKKAMLYFEFNQWDSRYDNISSMLIYFINTIIWHFWDDFSESHFLQELNFSSDTRSCCFDQCPWEQRRWFLERVIEEQSYSEAEYRLILSSSTRDGLAVEDFPDTLRINLDDCPAVVTLNGEVGSDLEAAVMHLIERRPIYKEFQQQLQMLFRQCGNALHLGNIMWTWLDKYPRGRPKSEIITKINKLSPPTTENIVHVMVSSLAPEFRERAENVFNWVQHASEPCLLFPDEATYSTDLHEECLSKEIVESLCGIIDVLHNDVKFCHSSFYLVPALGVGSNDEERVAKVNGTMAEICLHYLQLECVQDAITETCSETFEGNEWKTPLDAVVKSQSRATMAEYAVRFWPRHYEANGPYKPKQLVLEFFANKKSRGCWEMFLWLLSNPYTRPQRSYVSTLPMFAMFGLDDLVDEQVKFETGRSTINTNCWFAITEAARAGRSDTLQTALLVGAENGNENTLSTLIEKIPRLKAFRWPKNLFHRASAIGLGSVLTSMLQSGYDINELDDYYKSPAATIAARRNCVSSVEILLKSEPKADLSIKDISGDTLLVCAVRTGNPRMIETILKAGGNLTDTNSGGQTLTQIAVWNYKHKAAEILIRAGADFNSGGKDDTQEDNLRPPLILAAMQGALECARVLLTHGSDPLVSCATGTAFYEAVAGNNVEIARLLLEQEQQSDFDAHLPKREMLLLRAINTGNANLVSMLIEYGVKFEFADPNGGTFSTPLSRACKRGHLDIVKMLLEKKNVDTNYTGGLLESPLFAAVLHSREEVVTYLLQDPKLDIHWARRDGVNANPRIVRELLKRGVSIEHYSSWGTILHMAASRFPRTVRVLLEHYPKPDLERVCGDDMEVKSDIGCTPLQIACQYQSPKCIELLLNAGANAKFRSKNGMDAVDILLQANHYYRDIVHCLEPMLFESDYIDGAYVNAKGQTRLHMIHNKTPVDVVRLFVKTKAHLDKLDNDGYTPLAISIREDNMSVAKYLIKKGASVNVISPSFGSITHLVVAKGAVGLVKLLIDSGANCTAVDSKHGGSSLLYAALEIKDSSALQAMVKYLVDEAKVPIDYHGGELGYPLIKAADMTKTDYTTGIKMLKFLIRRKAQLNVTDSQRRRAVHFACTSQHADGIKSLVEAGAEIDVNDMFGRMPIHFAASSPSNSCLEYLLETQKHVDINAADHDGWTPLLWAARSGHASTITRLIAEKADVWARGRADNGRTEWSALKLMNFSGQNTALREELKPKNRIKINDNGKKEEWNDDLHDIKAGDKKKVICKSCLEDIIGFAWKCADCPDNFSLCFKCHSSRINIHDWERYFRQIEPLYEGDEKGAMDADETADLEATDLEESDLEESDLGDIGIIGHLNYLM